LREDFDCLGSDRGKKTTAFDASHDGRIAIFAAPSTCPPRGLICSACANIPGRLFQLARKETGDMRQLRSLLRSVPSRIGRRFAEIVAIAAESLPAAGA
jgi:hypothetical protein